MVRQTARTIKTCLPATSGARSVWERIGLMSNLATSTHLRRLRLAADIGGTFTDVAAFDRTNNRLLLGKNLSTPRAMVEGIEAGVKKAGTEFSEAGLFLHGSTDRKRVVEGKGE